MSKNIKKMTRWEIIQELRRHAHPSWFQSLMHRSTPALRSLLFYYQNGGTEVKRQEIIVRFEGVSVTIPIIKPNPKK